MDGEAATSNCFLRLRQAGRAAGALPGPGLGAAAREQLPGGCVAYASSPADQGE